MTQVDASNLRHDVPDEIRRGAAALKAAADRYAGLMGRQWVADERAFDSAGMLVRIAREALVLQEKHAAWIAEIWKGGGDA